MYKTIVSFAALMALLLIAGCDSNSLNNEPLSPNSGRHALSREEENCSEIFGGSAPSTASTVTGKYIVTNWNNVFGANLNRTITHGDWIVAGAPEENNYQFEKNISITTANWEYNEQYVPYGEFYVTVKKNGTSLFTKHFGEGDPDSYSVDITVHEGDVISFVCTFDIVMCAPSWPTMSIVFE